MRQTHRIWEQKAVGLIYDHYLHKVKIHTTSGECCGRDEVVADTVQQLAAFPDLALRGEGVIWNDENKYISHWVTRVAHNTGYSAFGKPTGKRICYPVATDSLVYEGRVVEVWEVYDGLLLAQQLGFGARQAVAALSVGYTSISSSGARSHGQLPPDVLPRPARSDGLESYVSWIWHEIWNRRRLDRIAQFCRPNYRFSGPSGRRLRTRDGFAAYVLGLLAAFPDATMTVEHVTALEEHVAVRWRLTGTHDGPGYGAPTGRRINILGITHHYLHRGQFVEERTVFDELALLVQLYSDTVTEPSVALNQPGL